jgi:poly-gamma-glutamate synthesis protein (capsule biosynthesis protein)
MTNPPNSVVLLGVGDIGPIHEPMESYSALVRSTLAGGDIRFAQCERVYSDRGALQVTGLKHSRLAPHMISVFSDCGFNVVSVAGNHAMDFGEEALLDTIALLRERGIQTVGAGGNIEEARKPAIVECNGVRVAILAYCSVVNEGYEARADRAGIAPLRVYTYYRPLEYQPGMPPKVVTTLHEEDLAAMVHDIAEAKKIADVVVLSLHWGIHFIPRMIADYQPAAAKAAFEAGADLILGHHAHVPKAIGVHDRKVCFYSLSNFIISTHEKNPAQAAAFARRTHGVELDPEYPRLSFGPDAKRSLIAKAVLGRDGVAKVGFLPVIIDKQLRPEVLQHSDPRFADMQRYMDWASEGFDHKFVVEGDEVVVTSAKA